MFYLCLVSLAMLPHVPGELDVETELPFRDSDEEPEPEVMRNVSDFDKFSSIDEKEITSLAAPAIARMRGRGHAMVWNGQIDSSDKSEATLLYNWASGRSRRRAAPLSSSPLVAGTNLPWRTRVRGTKTTGSSQPEGGPLV